MLHYVTFNIRCPWLGDGTNSFLHRAGGIVSKIQAEKPDVIGFQEVTDEIRGFLDSTLTDYTIVGHGREQDYRGESVPVAFRKDRFVLMGYENFWLSKTPAVPGSRYPGQSDCPRVCTCITLKPKDKPAPFRIYNIHLDHISDGARLAGIRQILAKIEADTQTMPYPFLLAGDFNATPDSPVIAACNAAPMEDLTGAFAVTYHAFGREAPMKIDYIFTDSKTARLAEEVTLWDGEHDGIFLSDHYPISAKINLF